MTIETAVYDANILFSATLRDLLMNLAIVQAVHARWSDEIHEEWIQSVLRHRSHARRDALERTRRAMDEAVDDGLVADYGDLIPTLQLPDSNDRHVLAVAIRAKAKYIVTFNLSDFPASTLDRYGVIALEPDAFIERLIETKRELVLDAAQRHRTGLKRPPKSVDEYLASLEKQKLPKTVAFLREHRNEI